MARKWVFGPFLLLLGHFSFIFAVRPKSICWRFFVSYFGLEAPNRFSPSGHVLLTEETNKSVLSSIYSSLTLVVNDRSRRQSCCAAWMVARPPSSCFCKFQGARSLALSFSASAAPYTARYCDTVAAGLLIFNF